MRTGPRGGAAGTAAGSRRWRLVRAGREAVPASVRRFSARARQRRLRAARPWLVAVLALALCAAVGWVVTGTALLGVRTVEVHGAVLVDPEQVRQAAAIAPGTPLATLDLSAVSHRVGALAPVRSAAAARDWPSTVVITVTERVAVAALAGPGEGWRLLDDQGVVFRTVPARPAGTAVFQLAEPGPADPDTRAALAVFAALTPALRANLVRLVALRATNIRLELSGGREIIWGDATQNAAKARVATSLLARPGDVIDVSAPDVVVVK